MKLKAKLNKSKLRIYSEVCVIPSALVAQTIAAAGADAIIIDQEHGAADIAALHAMIAATAGTDCAPLVRIPAIDPAYAKRALDMGAEGIVFPLTKTSEEAKACVSMATYPPTGIRGWGPFIAHSRWQVPLMDYLPSLGSKIVCILLIETQEAVQNIEDICTVEGVDCLFIAKFDLSTSLGVPGQFNHPKFTTAVEKIETAVLNSGIPLGGGPAKTEIEAADLLNKGYRVLAGFDLLSIKASTEESIKWISAYKKR